ncbi:MAG TPA: hypothetical protein VMF66_13340 [Candidatus Acidoferrum sp.]|nr:hypothetical protein [Candidatus Acidoferrum sp.]
MRTRIFPHLVSALVIACFAGTALAIPPRQDAAAGQSTSVYPTQQGFVDAHGVMIYYTIVGRGAPLMIAHGGPGADHTYFLPYLLPLARRNKLVFIDERGSGSRKSSRMPRCIRSKTW